MFSVNLSGVTDPNDVRRVHICFFVVVSMCVSGFCKHGA